MEVNTPIRAGLPYNYYSFPSSLSINYVTIHMDRWRRKHLLVMVVVQTANIVLIGDIMQLLATFKVPHHSSTPRKMSWLRPGIVP